MQGRRRDGINPTELQPGDYQLVLRDEKLEVWFCDPRGNIAHVNDSWTITEHVDGTISVAPSIFVNRGRADAWHGFLRHGVWVEA